MKKNKYAILLCIIVTLITASTSYAYFTGIANIQGSNGSNLSLLRIQNGKEEISIDTSNSKWMYSGNEVDENGIVNPNTGDMASYHGVKISNDSNLTSNVELKFTLNSAKEGGTEEDIEAIPPGEDDKVDTRPAAEKFEVWVGDVDRFNLSDGYGQGSAEKDKNFILNGGATGGTSLDIYPTTNAAGGDRNSSDKYDGTNDEGEKTNDAPGTDRRMVTSGFYNFYNKLLEQQGNSDKESIKVYITCDAQPYIHYWASDPVGQSSVFPGDKMTWEGGSLYSYEFKDVNEISLLFSKGSVDTKLSEDLSITKGEWYYSITLKKWQVFPGVESYYYYRNNNYENNDYPLSRANGVSNNAAFYGLTYYGYRLGNEKYFTHNSTFKGNLIGPFSIDNGELFYDGYTDRAMRKKNGSGGDYTTEHIQNGVNWAELQPVEPLTFMYQNKIDSTNGIKNKVNNATIQIMINDIQPSPSQEKWSDRWNNGNYSSDNSDWLTSFSGKSNVEYQVTLKIKDSKMEPIRVEEWEKIINNLDQHGTVGNLVTLSVPERLLYLVEEGEGKGLELLIDDPRDGSTINELTGKPDVAAGDSYCIDFARLLVNEEVSTVGTVDGIVKDSEGKPIEGVKVSSISMAEPIKTDKDGKFSIDVIPGQIVLSFSHPNYVDREYTIYNVSSGDNITIEITMINNGNMIIVPQVKFEGKLTLTKYKKASSSEEKDTLVQIDGQDSIKYDIKLGEAGIVDNSFYTYTELKIEPNHYYILDYDLNLFRAEDIDKFATNGFSLTFSSDIEAKITQENNPGWSENGD